MTNLLRSSAIYLAANPLYSLWLTVVNLIVIIFETDQKDFGVRNSQNRPIKEPFTEFPSKISTLSSQLKSSLEFSKINFMLYSDGTLIFHVQLSCKGYLRG